MRTKPIQLYLPLDIRILYYIKGTIAGVVSTGEVSIIYEDTAVWVYSYIPISSGEKAYYILQAETRGLNDYIYIVDKVPYDCENIKTYISEKYNVTAINFTKSSYYDGVGEYDEIY